MKKQAVNTFDGGMVTDIDELHTKSNTLTYARNTEYITTEGNQLILQKRESRELFVPASVSPGFNIKAVEVIDDVAYIISTSAPGIISGDIIDINFTSNLEELSFYGAGILRGQVFDTALLNNLKVTGASVNLKRDSALSLAGARARLYAVNSSNGTTVDATLLGQSNTIGSSEIDLNFTDVVFEFSEEIDTSPYSQILLMVESIDSGDITIRYTTNDTAYSSGYAVYGSTSSTTISIENTVKAFKCKLTGSYETNGSAELGTFPSPSYPAEEITEDTVVEMVDKYSPLMNFNTTSQILDQYYNLPFTTEELNIEINSYVGLELQKTYDGSVNMVFSSTDNPIRLINTKFKANNDGTATLIKRRLTKNDNVYSADQFQKTEIIPRATTVGYISNVEIREGGALPAGGNRYYIKYITADGVETDVIEESRTIDIHYSDSVNIATGGDVGEIMPKMVKLELSGLDKAFKGIRVYFSISAGEVQAATKLYQIVNTYDITDQGTATVLHTGYEDTIEADPDTFALSYSQIKDSKIITKVNNRLALSGSSASLKHKDEYATLATYIQVNSEISDDRISAPLNIDDPDINDKTHANPKAFYDSGEYWDAETYEFGVVFITPEGNTPVYPIQGFDKVKSLNAYNTLLLGNISNDFDPTTGQNPKGIYRTESVDSFFKINKTGTDTMDFRTVHITMDMTKFRAQLSKNTEYSDIIGYYFVRKKRKKDALMRGLFTPTVAIPQVSTFGYDNVVYTPVFWNGGRPEIDSTLLGGYKRVPYPDMIMPYSCRAVRTSDSNSDTIERLFDFQLRTTIAPGGPLYSYESSFAFYSPDIECNTTYAASAFAARDFGTHIYRPLNMVSSSIKKNYGGSYNKSGVYIHNRWTGPTTGITISKSREAIGTLTFVTEDTLGASSGSFAGSTDRNMWLYHPDGYDFTILTNELIYSSSISNKAWYDRDVDETDKSIGSNALRYGRYIGIKYKDENYIRDLDLLEMHMPQVRVDTVDGSENINLDFTVANDGTEWDSSSSELTSGSANHPFFHANDITGFLCTVYNGVNTAPLEFDRWKEKYTTDDNSFYFAISRRYPIETVVDSVNIGDGDCYSGLMWKRVFRPRGIDEAPQATDTTAYSEDYRDLGMANFGYAISIPCKSNYNFHLRVPSNEDDVEYDIFGQKRSFLPSQGIDAVRGSKLDETAKFNHGYGANYESQVPVYRLNPDSPYYKAEQPNRVYVSDTDIESNFVNGFTQFKGLSYRDYNSELGPIRAMVTLRGKIVAVFDSGVATIGVDERSMIPGTDGDIYMDSAEALASKSEVKSTILGSDQPNSVITTSNFVYGVDTKQYKIWRTNFEQFKSISDLKVQSWLKETIAELNNDATKKFTVYTTYDIRKSEVLFTFTTCDPLTGIIEKSKSIAYNELLSIWVCETDEHNTTMFFIEENKYASRPVFESNVYKYEYSTNVNLLNGESAENTIIEFIINKDQNEVKVLENLMIVGNSVLPDTINYTTDIYKRRKGIPTLNQTVNTRTPVVVKIKTAASVDQLGLYSLRFNDSGLNDINHPITGLPLEYGELVTMISSNGDIVKTKILSISEDGKDISFADKVSLDQIIDFYIGHKSGVREYNTEIHEGITYLIPSCMTNSNITQPRGKWIKVNMELDGTDQMYVSGIASVYNQSLS